MSFEEDFNNLGLLYLQRDQVAKKIQELELTVRDQIRAGETTGNPVVDFLHVALGDLDEEKVNPYLDLQERVNANIGQPALAVYKEEHIVGCPGIVPPDYIKAHNLSVKTTSWLGRINAPMDYGRADEQWQDALIIPVDQQYQGGSPIRAKEFTPIDGPVWLDFDKLFVLGNEVEDRPRGRGVNERHPRGLKVYIGDELEQAFTNMFGKVHQDSYDAALELLK